MRIDHHAYQRATRVASFGLLLQIFIGLLLLVFGLIRDDTAYFFASMYTLSGLVVWLGLIVTFYQHKLERLEALEEDELASSRGAETASMFEMEADELHVAARRLRLMHKWLMPIGSLFLALLLGLLAWWMFRFMQNLTGDVEIATDFDMTENKGWAISICLGISVTTFIFSRFVAGMSKQPAWQNLRGGAGYMVGTAILCLAVAVGIGFRFFDNERVIVTIGFAIPIFMLVIAAEIVLNFILNLYRPRIPGEVPRPAFDSKMLSLFAAPDNLVRSMNEAVNYQFGFDVTSTWGYQLLLRSVTWLLVIGVATLVLLNTMVVVEPHQQAVKLAGGAIVGDVHDSGIMWKLPWPLQSAEVHDVHRIQTLALTPKRLRLSQPLRSHGDSSEISLWTESLQGKTDTEMVPFIVGASRLSLDEGYLEDLAPVEGDVAVISEDASNRYSLLVAEMELEYRINADGGLKDYLLFASDSRGRRSRLDERERTLKALALSEINTHLSRVSLDEALALGDVSLAEQLKAKIQESYDAHATGVEVVAVNLPMMRPVEGTENAFEELSISREARLQQLAQTNQIVVRTQVSDVGDPAMLAEVLAGIDEWERLKGLHGIDAPETIVQRDVVQDMLMRGGGVYTALAIAQAESTRWERVLQAKIAASRTQGQVPAYRAAPNLYRQREIMRVLTAKMAGARKYIIGIDPSRFRIDVELQELNPLLNFQDAILDEGEEPNG